MVLIFSCFSAFLKFPDFGLGLFSWQQPRILTSSSLYFHLVTDEVMETWGEPVAFLKSRSTSEDRAGGKPLPFPCRLFQHGTESSDRQSFRNHREPSSWPGTHRCNDKCPQRGEQTAAVFNPAGPAETHPLPDPPASLMLLALRDTEAPFLGTVP